MDNNDSQSKKNISNDNNNSEVKRSNKTLTETEDHIAKYLHSKSFFNLATIFLKSLQLGAPYPLELEYEEIVNLYPTAFLDGYEVKENGVYCNNEDIVKRQTGVFTEMAKQMAKGLFSKTGVVSISLPIRIFEPRSMLERYTDWWCFAPILLKKAGSCKDKIEAFKYVICFVMSAMFLSTGQLKPFNPMLGETYEAVTEDGSKIYLEHSSHIPCVSNFLMIDSEGLYKFYGFSDIGIEGTLKMVFNNYVTMVQKGKNSVFLKTTGQTISYQLPKVVLGGMIVGSRYILLDGHMKFEDKENNLKATICFNKSHPNLKLRRIHDFYGQIYSYDYSKEKNVPFYEDKLPKNSFPTNKNLIHSEITGSWIENVIFDNQILWTICDNLPPQIYPTKSCVPSDSRYREDLCWLKRGTFASNLSKEFEDYAQKWKVALEVQQRHDRSLREKYKKK